MIRAFIGAQKFDETVVREYLDTIPVGSQIIVGDGKGAEQFIKNLATERGLIVTVPLLRPEYGNRYSQMMMQVAEICGLILENGGTLVIIGKGTRPKFAHGWIKTLTKHPLYSNVRLFYTTKLPLEIVEL